MATVTAAIPASFAHLSDDVIIARVVAGDLDAYEGIMRHHNQRLYRIARSIVTDDAEAMDVVQETFIVAYERLHELKAPTALQRLSGVRKTWKSFVLPDKVGLVLKARTI